MKFNYYCDPGHGWVKVKRSLLIKLGIDSQISGFSYQRDDNVFLEEDCDASLLFDKLDSKFIPWQVERNHTDKRSKIRSYQHYQAGV